MKSWYVVQTKPWKEEWTLHWLNEKGVETFFPRIKVARYRDMKAGITIKPMFPSYLFTRFEAPEEVPYVQWTRGVKRILGADDKPIPVADEVVAFIQERADEWGVVKVERRLRHKDRVRIRSGPFKDFLGIFERHINDQGRVEILLDMIEYQARIKLHESLVERIS